MTDAPSARRMIARRWRWILAPVLAFVALSAWAFASPVGAGPDDDYHLVSIWCANGGGEQCAPGEAENSREVSSGFVDLICYAQKKDVSAACQEAVWDSWGDDVSDIRRGNFAGEYPPVYYATMNLLAGPDIQVSALTMRVFNAALFVGLATALAVLLPPKRRETLLWGWLVTLVPLGMFLIPSNNPSGWAITGVGTAFLALLGWFETSGRRRWALGVLYLVGILMAAGARGDAAVYAAGATVTVVILTSERSREWALKAILPAAGFIIACALFATAAQAGTGMYGFGGGEVATLPIPSDSSGQEIPPSGLSLAAYNLLMLPFLWTGVWGTWGLGWLDTQLPAIVPWAACAAFIVVMFAGIGRMGWRKLVALSGVLAVLVALPVYVLTVGGDPVGVDLQPRYLLPLIVLFAMIALFSPFGDGVRFTRLQLYMILGALALANLVALQINIRRYVTGADQQGLNLDSGAEWWWSGVPFGPSSLWIIGSLAFAGAVMAIGAQLRRDSSGARSS